jgi:secreted PhoX family phosphatase
MGGAGMKYESAAYDNRDPMNVTFYITVDEIDGPLVKFTPDQDAVQYAVNNNDYTNLLHTNGPTVKYEYFKVTSINATGEGTFEWTTSLAEGRASGASYHVHGEGIDIRNGELFYTTKSGHYLFTISLDNGTFLRTSTKSGVFDSQPDQVARVLNNTDGTTDDILYFCEDGGDNCGVHGRDAQGRFFTILNDVGGNFAGETTGLAFSPEGIFMYVAFQVPGHIFEIRRTDGLPFQGQRLDIKYHQSDDNESPFIRERELFADNEKTCELVSATCNAHTTS